MDNDINFIRALIALGLFFIIYLFMDYYFPCFFINKLQWILGKSLDDWYKSASILYGALGLYLGYLFFIKKNEFDNDILRNEKSSKFVQYIYDEINNADKIVSIILKADLTSQQELDSARAKLDTMFLSLNNLLDNNDALLRFTSDELDTIIKLHSHISNNNIIFNADLDKITIDDANKEKLNYIPVLQEARSTCLQKLASY